MSSSTGAAAGAKSGGPSGAVAKWGDPGHPGYGPAMALGVDGVRVGCWQHPETPTGVTVVLPPPGTVGGAAVRGAAPGSREVDALSATGSVEECHAIVLTGGSAFGLATADGVMGWCEQVGSGLELPTVTVPIVAAAVVFDIRDRHAPRPDAAAGAAACRAATLEDPAQGSVGVGTGCSAGKVAGRDWAVAGGQGWAVARAAGVTVGAIMAVNPVGEVFDEQGELLAGTRAPQGHPRFPEQSMAQIAAWGEPPSPGTNTVIGCVVTDAALTKLQACRAADLAHSGIARAVRPAHTSADGDILFLLATGSQGAPATVDLVAELAARAVATAIRSAVAHATGSEWFPPDPRARAYRAP